MTFAHQLKQYTRQQLAESRNRVQVAEIVQVDPLVLELVESGVRLDTDELRLAGHVAAFAEDPGLQQDELVTVFRQELSGDIYWLVTAVDSERLPENTGGGFSNVDGGSPSSVYGGMPEIDGGSL